MKYLHSYPFCIYTGLTLKNVPLALVFTLIYLDRNVKSVPFQRIIAGDYIYDKKELPLVSYVDSALWDSYVIVN